tara:strand:+ start:1627 stop:2148 length:522 start_codon:yes stop_codon:yes gene_type:complete
MYISHKSNVIQSIEETEWQCRRVTKRMSLPEYWTWLESVTSGDPPVPDYSGEDYEIVETDELLSYVDSEGRTFTYQQSGHIVSDLDGTHYHLKWDGSKIVRDDDALAAYQLAEKWKRVRQDRDRLLNETDWIVTKAKETNTNIPAAWKTYRQALRDVPSQSDPDNITWPTKPS